MISTIRFKFAALSAVIFLCASCVDVNQGIGTSFVPDTQKYTIVTNVTVPLDVDMQYSDLLSGYSQYFFTVGAINDAEQGRLAHSCVLDLLPLADTLDFGTNPTVKSFRFSAALDTVSVADKSQTNILQNLSVFALNAPISPKTDYTAGTDLSSRIDRSVSIVAGTPVLNGRDSLSFDFTKEYASQYLGITQSDLKNLTEYRKKINGIYLEVQDEGQGGRINNYELQLSYDASSFLVSGNYAELNINSTYSGVNKDTTFLFYFSPSKIYPVDSLLTNSSSGALPLYCLNLASHDTTATGKYRGHNQRLLHVAGGTGLKPRIGAVELKKAVEAAITKNGHNPSKVIISHATLVFPFEQQEGNYEKMFRYPIQLSPNVRYPYKYTIEGEGVWHTVHADLSDYSTDAEDKGDLNRRSAPMEYAPDVTYHLQSILSLDANDKALVDTMKYDIWLLAKSEVTVTTVTAGSDEMADYYSMLAYQSYYGSMYGGSTSSYGDYYSNYYSYMLAAMYAGNSSTSTSTSMSIDTGSYFDAVLYGPAYSAEPDEVPHLVFSYAIPNSEL